MRHKQITVTFTESDTATTARLINAAKDLMFGYVVDIPHIVKTAEIGHNTAQYVAYVTVIRKDSYFGA